MAKLFTSEDRRRRLQELSIAVDDIASLYRNPNIPPNCECIGMECEKPGCAEWWTAFFIEFGGKELIEMVNLYLFE